MGAVSGRGGVPAPLVRRSGVGRGERAVEVELDRGDAEVVGGRCGHGKCAAHRRTGSGRGDCGDGRLGVAGGRRVVMEFDELVHVISRAGRVGELVDYNADGTPRPGSAPGIGGGRGAGRPARSGTRRLARVVASHTLSCAGRHRDRWPFDKAASAVGKRVRLAAVDHRHRAGAVDEHGVRTENNAPESLKRRLSRVARDDDITVGGNRRPRRQGVGARAARLRERPP